MVRRSVRILQAQAQARTAGCPPTILTRLDAYCLCQVWFQTWTLSSHLAVWRSAIMPFLAVAHLASSCGLRALDRLEALGVGDFSQSVVGLLLPTPQSSIEHALPLGLAVGFGLVSCGRPLNRSHRYTCLGFGRP